MKEITDFLNVFFNIFRNDIFEYYQKTYSYLRDLIKYKKIDLKKRIETENENQVKNTLDIMLKAIKTGLNTIGIPIEKLNQNQNTFLENLSKERIGISDYNNYFEIYVQNYVNVMLFDILIDYLLNIDEKKLENVNLFDLSPPYFISKLNEFKRSHFSNKEILELFNQQNYMNYINFKDLTLIKPVEISGKNLLDQLREAKEGFIETLKKPKKELLKHSIDKMRNEIYLKDTTSQIKVNPPIIQMEQSLNIVLDTNTFLDHFGNFKPLHPEIVKKFEIDKLSLTNSKIANHEFFDLESLFYYVSILKMLNLELPFSDKEILEIIKNFTNRWVFSSSIDELPDPISNFYGLAIFSELDLLNKTNIIDLEKIENFVMTELENAIPERLELNLHSFLCVKLIIKMKKKLLEKKINQVPISDLDLLEMVHFKPTLDIFNHLSSLKLLGKEEVINKLKIIYANEIKKSISSNGSVNDLITESARTLLIFELLNLKKVEQELCKNLFNFILTKTSFFTKETLDTKFSWRSDILGFKIELQMLYWVLLASSVYNSRNI